MSSLKKIPILKVILIIWIVFASLYVVYGEYQRVQIMVAQRSYQAGLRDAVNQLIEQAQTCQPIPVTSGEDSVSLISLACLNPPTEETTEEVE
ncbi:MAG: hypothetical protein DRQ47_09970 [Gammaproteobacteria bacterium]|nr:MAG: hypothetical protein DRQ47_09970 [Gammaproteobacteria bacterium]HHA18791.1 hypothetical protein [Methylophaga sp.]